MSSSLWASSIALRTISLKLAMASINYKWFRIYQERSNSASTANKRFRLLPSKKHLCLARPVYGLNFYRVKSVVIKIKRMMKIKKNSDKSIFLYFQRSVQSGAISAINTVQLEIIKK
jgi:hypothetical protein